MGSRSFEASSRTWNKVSFHFVAFSSFFDYLNEFFIILFYVDRYITMGRHNMEVWYQSPYPDDAARLPKLYLCEFCLRYQKSEITMKRHAAKCVWRHPPGDEVSDLLPKSHFFHIRYRS